MLKRIVLQFVYVWPCDGLVVMKIHIILVAEYGFNQQIQILLKLQFAFLLGQHYSANIALIGS